MDTLHPHWPKWYFGPNGESEIFHKESDVPHGWHDHPSKHEKKAKSSAHHTPGTTPSTHTKAATNGEFAEVDAAGTPWDAKLHSPNKTKTKAGLWRMAVGKARPEVQKHDL